MRRSLLIYSLAAALACALPGRAQEAQLPPVEEFVSALFYHGVPFETAARYGPEAAAPLLAMLKDQSRSQYWANAVWVLGILGTPEAEAALVDFLENRFTGEVDRLTLQALLLVPQALGFSAHDPETQAFKYVAAGTDPATWRGRDLAWTFEGWEEGTRDVLLAKLSVNGLGLAGNAAARQYLVEMAGRLPEAEPELWRVLEPNVEESIALSRQIEELGYLRVLSSKEPRYPSEQRPEPQQ